MTEHQPRIGRALGHLFFAGASISLAERLSKSKVKPVAMVGRALEVFALEEGAQATIDAFGAESRFGKAAIGVSPRHKRRYNPRSTS